MGSCKTTCCDEFDYSSHLSPALTYCTPGPQSQARSVKTREQYAQPAYLLCFWGTAIRYAVTYLSILAAPLHTWHTVHQARQTQARSLKTREQYAQPAYLLCSLGNCNTTCFDVFDYSSCPSPDLIYCTSGPANSTEVTQNAWAICSASTLLQPYHQYTWHQWRLRINFLSVYKHSCTAHNVSCTNFFICKCSLAQTRAISGEDRVAKRTETPWSPASLPACCTLFKQHRITE